MAKNTTNIKVQGATIKIVIIENEEYLSLTDIAGANDDRPDLVIQNWMRNKNTIDFLAEWERKKQMPEGCKQKQEGMVVPMPIRI